MKIARIKSTLKKIKVYEIKIILYEINTIFLKLRQFHSALIA